MKRIGEESDVKSLMQQLMDRAKAEAATVPCALEVEKVGLCSDEYAATCELRERKHCPRQLVHVQQLKDERALAERRAALLERGIPERVIRRVFDQRPKETQAMVAVRAFMRAPDLSILILSGTNACGKTTAAAWACLPPADADWPSPAPGRFVRLVDLESDGRYGDLLKLARSSKLLVLDDMGAAHFGQSGFMVSMVDDVVDAVYQACNKIILTTDLAMAPDPKDPSRPCLAKLLSRRVLSRIKDAGTVETKLGGRHGG